MDDEDGSEGDDVPDRSFDDAGSVLTWVGSAGLRRCGMTGLKVILEGPAAGAGEGPGPLVDLPLDGTILIVGLVDAILAPGVELRWAVGVDTVRALLVVAKIGFGTGRVGGAEGRERGGGAEGASLAMGGTP